MLTARLVVACLAAAAVPAVALAGGLPTEPAAVALPVTPVAETQAAPPLDKSSAVVLRIDSSGRLSQLFTDLGYTLDGVRSAQTPVPRMLLAKLPSDLDDVRSLAHRKELFLGALLPVILLVNEQILADRQRLIVIDEQISSGQAPSFSDLVWMHQLAASYRLRSLDRNELFRRVDAIPPSMALAQAAVESGWGTSRIARDTNALFGQTVSGGGYASYEHLVDCVRAYATNLNSHRVYADFRERRAARRANGGDLDGHDLMGSLMAYSERGGNYIALVRDVIDTNNLWAVDRAWLHSQGVAPPSI